MKSKNKLTISIGTAAYNEEQNIKHMLASVLSQKEENIKIKEILVISDGSSDNTMAYAKTFKDKRIKIFDDQKRLGKTPRVNQLIKMFKSDILIVIDADCIIDDANAIEEMANKFTLDNKVGFVGGNAKPLPGQNFLEKAINNYIDSRIELSRRIDTDNAYFARALFAYSRDFAKVLEIPAKIINDDTYSFIVCHQKGFRFAFAPKAIAWFRSPQNINDHLKQGTRHIQGGHQLEKYFGKKTVKDAFKLPLGALQILALMQITKNPFGYFFLKIVNIYSDIKHKVTKTNFDVKWDASTTSKKLVI